MNPHRGALLKARIRQYFIRSHLLPVEGHKEMVHYSGGHTWLLSHNVSSLQSHERAEDNGIIAITVSYLVYPAINA